MLRPDSKRRWVWTNDEWDRRSPGTFAVIIGVSDYAYLDGSPECFGMGKLFVSASTAHRFFEWLASTYKWTNCPIAKCWLLLAPTTAELAADPSIGRNSKLPDFQTCHETILDWHAEMSGLSPSVAKGSRSLFFFSGHGLEILPERQILLPLDYQPISLNRALSTQNLARGLRSLSVPLHFIILDACRNDHNNLDRFEPLTGTMILNEPRSRSVNPDTFVPIFYGSATGTSAYQPTLGLSLFGESLLDGLVAKGLKPDCTSGICLIDWLRLRPFVENHIAEIVQSRYSPMVKQRARVHGDWTEEAITEVLPSPGREQPSMPGGPPGATTDSLSIRMPSSETIRPISANRSRLNEFLGSERITYMWLNGARVFDYGSQDWLPKGFDMEISGLRRTESSTAFMFDLTIPAAQGGRRYWLEFRDEVQTVGCTLPIDQDAGTRFRLEMEFALKPLAVTRLDVYLSPENEGDLGLAARLWLAPSKFSAQEITLLRDSMLPATIGAYETSFPLIALTTASVLLRYRQWDMLEACLDHIPDTVSDAAVFRSELYLRNPKNDEESYAEALRYFIKLDDNFLPSFAEASAFALQQSEIFISDDSLDTSRRTAIQKIHARLVKSMGIFRVGGLFVTFTGPSNRVSPALMEPEVWLEPEAEAAEAEEETKKRGKGASAGA